MASWLCTRRRSLSATPDDPRGQVFFRLLGGRRVRPGSCRALSVLDPAVVRSQTLGESLRSRPTTATSRAWPASRVCAFASIDALATAGDGARRSPARRQGSELQRQADSVTRKRRYAATVPPRGCDAR
jgi:hypothetical protein